MAISFYVGIPRSGKTYKAMVLLYYTFVKPKNKIYFKIKDYVLNENETIISLYKFLFLKIYIIKEVLYDNAYTNINQFNFEISDKIFKFNFDEIYEKLQILHSLYLAKYTDDVLIEKAKELNIYKSLFVLDECHNYLKSKENPVLIFWFTYHAHFHQTIVLITQDLKLVNDEYKRVGEFFYKAIPQRLRMSKNTFRYRSYSSYTMYIKDYITSETVKADKKIFALYVSGAEVHDKPIIYKYILILIMLFSFVTYAFIHFMDNLNPNKKDDSQNKEVPQTSQIQTTQPINNPKNETSTPEQNQQIQTQNNPVVEDITILKLFKFNCFDTLCYFQFDDRSTFEIPQNILKVYLLDIEDKNKFLELKNNRLSIYVLAPETKFNFIKQGVVNENKNETGAFNNPINAK